MPRGFLTKNMKFLRFISTIFILLSLNACQEEGLAGEIKSLQNEAESTLDEIQEMDSIPFLSEYEQAKQLIDKASPFFNTLDKFSQKKVADLASAEKWHRKSGFTPIQLQHKLDYSVNQLNALYSEYKSDSITEASAKKYLLVEKDVLQKLIQESSDLKVHLEQLDTKYSRLIPQVSHIVDSLEKAK